MEIWEILNENRKKQFKIILILMILVSVTEIVSIGAVLPFLAVLTTPNKLNNDVELVAILYNIGIVNEKNIILTITIIFISTVIISGVLKFLLLWMSTKFSHMTGADLSNEIYKKTLYQDYTFHLSRNSSEIIAAISNKVNIVINNLLHALNLISSTVMMMSILLIMIYIEPKGTLIAISTISIVYMLMLKITRKKAYYNSLEISKNNSKIIKIIQESLFGIREIIINGNQEKYRKIYETINIKLRKAQNSNSIISSSPRNIVETISIVIICIIAYKLNTSNQNDSIIPILGSLALGAQRLLPAVQQIYSSISSIRGDQESVNDAIKLLKQKQIIGNENNALNVNFESQIELIGIEYSYNDNNKIINNFNLEIKKGEKIGIVGVTGSGKSTLIDIIMKLLVPTNGKIFVDGVEINENNKKSWQKKIAHVAQKIFLLDDTISVNIAFSESKENIDYERVKKVATIAQISTEIEKMEFGYETIIGENGIRLSGGQQQRIGIARALYKNSELLIFDEATSALDSNTELKVMEAINKLNENITIILIAHRLSTLEKCNKIIEINKI